MKRKCAVCHKSDKRNQMFQDGYYPDVWIHLKCLNSDKAIQWRQKKRSEDSNYNRYMELVSDGVFKQCKRCGYHITLCVKATKPVWEMNCSQCHRVNLNALNPYSDNDKSLYKELQNMRELFLRSSSEPTMSQVQKTMELLASQYDDFGKCKCGGMFSIAGEPRCAHCGEIIVHSYFHYVAPEAEDL